MCGIVGILGNEPVAGQLVDALKRLEYRGYDSAGVATLEDGKLVSRRAAGKLRALEAKLEKEPLKGMSGIGHTRWATHGKPTEGNAHPHLTDRVAVVHNGIIENFRELREHLAKNGTSFNSDTDTEIVAHLVTEHLNNGKTPVDAVAATLKELRGAFALAFLFAGEDDLMIGARKGSPLAVGYGDGEMYLGSDAIALAPFTDSVSYLEDGDWVVLTRKSAVIRNARDEVVERPVIKSNASAMLVDKGNFKHFMAKEIHEQPEVVGHTLARYIDMTTEEVVLPGELPFDWTELKRLSISACGTAFYAGLVAKYWFERFAKLPVEIDIASEFRYREAPLEAGDLAIFISQSGETADTLASLRYAKEHKLHVLSVVNVPTSTIARESDVVMPTLAGPEIGVASTKAFTCQLSVLACLAIAAGRARGVLSEVDEQTPGACADRDAAADDAGAVARAADREARARSLQGARRALSRPRHQLPDRARRRAQAQGNLLYPRRGLCRRRAQARADRADRRDHAGDRDRAARPRVREDRVQHGGGGRPRRQNHPGDRPEGRRRGGHGTHGHADAAGHGGDGDAAGLCHAGAADRLSYRGGARHRRRPAAQSREIGHGGIRSPP